MKPFLLTLSFTIFLSTMQNLSAQTIQSGEYYLEGVMEVGSGFRLNPDKTFEFFFSYGAMDREAKGTWEQKGDSLILNNARKPSRDFVLVASKQTKDKHITIQIKDPNQQILRYVECQIKTDKGTQEGRSDEKGRITFDPAVVQAISLIHVLWSDRLSVFEVAQPSDTYFEFTIDPHIVDVEFNNLVLRIEEKELRGPHPLLEKKEVTYVRAE